MVVGETKTIEIEPENAYGQRFEHLITEVSKNQVPETIQVGETLQGNTPNGPIIVKVVDVNDETVTLDANHPLAGQKLIFDLELVGIS
jgi:FKBP-type peptidyl-prolyl cis-trans isomerase 2